MNDSKSAENVVYIGNKPVASYVMACATQLQGKKGAKITLKARGRAISRAVDVAEVLKNRFMQGLVEVDKIKTSTEQIETREGNMSNISAIEITMKKIKD